MKEAPNCERHFDEFSAGLSDGDSEQRPAHGSTSGFNGNRGQKVPLFLTPKICVFQRPAQKACFLASDAVLCGQQSE